MDSPKRILIADDNPRILKLLNAVLHNDFEVVCVADGVALEEELLRYSYDLLITDLQMPKRPGIVALRRFERHCATAPRPIVPVIIMTGMDASNPSVLATHEMPSVRSVFHKPFDLYMLAARVRELLGRTGDNYLTLPCAESADVQKPPTILVVDDDEEVAQCVAAQIEEEGYVTHCHTNPETALQNCKQFKYDMIILDYMLGNIQCNEWLAKLYAAVPQKQRPPVLIVTGFGNVVARDQFAQWPTVKSVLSKPFQLNELLSEVRANILPEGAELKPL